MIVVSDVCINYIFFHSYLFLPCNSQIYRQIFRVSLLEEGVALPLSFFLATFFFTALI